MEQATERIMVKASVERCFAVAIDFDTYPSWSKAFKKVDIVERDDAGRPSLVHFWAEGLGRSTSYALRYDYSEAPNRLTWKLEEGDIQRRLDGQYVFATVGDQTELTFHLSVELKVPMPGFVKRRAENRILGAALQELKARSELPTEA